MSDETPEPTDSVGALAADLRALRLRAESPTLAKIQHDSGVSRSVLSSAFGGRQLPSARTIDRTVRALGEDAAPWVARRDAIARRTGADLDPIGDEDVPAREAVVSRNRAALLVGVAFVAGFVVAIAASWAVGASIVQQVRAAAADAAKAAIEDAGNPRAQINVHNGVDPALSPCVNDAEVATSEMRDHNTKLEIIWSNKCYAGWARITRYDERFSGNSMTVSIYPETAAHGPDRQTAEEPNVQSAYTTLVVRPTPETRLCAVGAITVDGESIDLGGPLCT